MSNMAHCMFENTTNDLLDCQEQLQEKGVKFLQENANQYERKYIKHLVKVCMEIAEEFGEDIEEDEGDE